MTKYTDTELLDFMEKVGGAVRYYANAGTKRWRADGVHFRGQVFGPTVRQALTAALDAQRAETITDTEKYAAALRMIEGLFQWAVSHRIRTAIVPDPRKANEGWEEAIIRHILEAKEDENGREC